jgi:hypothetical protein
MKAILTILMLTIHLGFYAQQNNIKLTNSSHSICDNSDIERIRQRIINQYFVNDTLNISLGIIAECDLDDPFIGIIQSNDTIDFKIERKPLIEYDSITHDTIYSQMIVECHCCYEFYFKILGLTSKNYYVRVNNELLLESNEKYLTYPVKYELSQIGDTINYKDKYGLNQGLWIRNHKDGSIDKIKYVNGKPTSFKKYYSNGQIKCDCICRPDHEGLIELIQETGECKYWDINGNRINK